MADARVFTGEDGKFLADKIIANTTAISGKVDKETGKGLSTNDYTAADKAIVDGVTAALADRYTKAQTDEKIAEAMTDVDNEHFHVVTVLPDAADAKENHEYVLVTYEPGTTTIATEVHYLFYDGEYHQRTTTVSLDGYATEQYVDNKTVDMRYKVEMDDAAPPESMVLKGDSEAALQPTMTFAGTDDTLEYSAENESGSYAITLPSKAYVDGAVSSLDTRVTANETAIDKKVSIEDGRTGYVLEGKQTGVSIRSVTTSVADGIRLWSMKKADTESVYTTMFDKTVVGKDYVDGKTLSATGWGVVTTGEVLITGITGTTSGNVTLDLSGWGFTSVDDYEIFTTVKNNYSAISARAWIEKQSAASAKIIAITGQGDSVAVFYVVVAKGYGAVAYTGALPEGGTAGQALVKRSGDDGDVAWADAGGGTVDQTYNATSTNAQSGTAVAGAVATKQDALTAGNGVEILDDGTINMTKNIVATKKLLWSGSVGNGTITLSEPYTDYDELEVVVSNGLSARHLTGSSNVYQIRWNSSNYSYINTLTLTGETTATASAGGGSSSGNSATIVSVSGIKYGVAGGGGGDLPTGGTTGQALVKKSDADGDVEWDDIGGTVTLDDTMSDTSENGVKNKVIKSYVDNKTLNPTGWGVAKIGQVSLSSTTEVTVDITDLGFMSVDDYEVFLTLNDATTSNIVPRVASKTLTSFGIKKSSSGSNIPVNYVVIGKGYGGGSSYRDLILDTAMSDTSDNGVENKVIKAYVDSMVSVDDALSTESTHAVQNKVITEKVNDLQSQIGNLGEPFRVKQFQTVIDATLPMVTEEVANTAIPNIDLTIDDTEGADYQIAGMLSYEVFDAETGGNRINCFPVCQFTMNSQKTIRIRMMCGGTARKTAKRISAWVLLKHR